MLYLSPVMNPMDISQEHGKEGNRFWGRSFIARD